MASFVIEIADALVAKLIAAGFTQAERKPAPYVTREDLGDDTRLVVFVRNRTDDEIGSRAGLDHLVDLGIAIQRAADPTATTDTDAGVELVTDLWALFDQGGALYDEPLAAAWLDSGPTHPTGRLYEPKHLQALRLFTSISAVVYRLQT